MKYRSCNCRHGDDLEKNICRKTTFSTEIIIYAKLFLAVFELIF